MNDNSQTERVVVLEAEKEHWPNAGGIWDVKQWRVLSFVQVSVIGGSIGRLHLKHRTCENFNSSHVAQKTESSLATDIDLRIQACLQLALSGCLQV